MAVLVTIQRFHIFPHNRVIVALEWYIDVYAHILCTTMPCSEAKSKHAE